jgi:hypothetical protein
LVASSTSSTLPVVSTTDGSGAGIDGILVAVVELDGVGVDWGFHDESESSKDALLSFPLASFQAALRVARS